jgi:hypothetical protein
MSDIAWAAGLFEGEGCFSTGKNTSKNSLTGRCSLQMTDEDIVKRFYNIVKVGTINKRTFENKKDAWTWTTAGFEKFLYIVSLFWKFLGERRKQRASEILNILKDRFEHRKNFCINGHPRSEENLYHYKGQKHCAICRKETARRFYLKRSNDLE